MHKLMAILLGAVLLTACSKTSYDPYQYYRSYSYPEPGKSANASSLSPDGAAAQQETAQNTQVITWQMVINSSYWKYLDQLQEEYIERMQRNVKKNAKIAKELEKPQYADPTYFGHKKKPKKRAVGKKKFCKECGIWH